MRTVIGVMGSGKPLDDAEYARAYHLGALIARHGWILLTGGSPSGVMDAASHGASEAGGLVIGIVRGTSVTQASKHVDIAICTGMGDARNVINVLSSDVVIALPGGAGTLSEIALGIKNGKTVITLGWNPGEAFVASGPGTLLSAETNEEVLVIVSRCLETGHLPG